MAEVKKERKKIVVPKIIKIKSKEKTDQIEILNRWIKNSEFRDQIIKDISSDDKEEDLKTYIGEQLGCKIFSPGSEPLKIDECGILDFEFQSPAIGPDIAAGNEFGNYLIVRKKSGLSVINSILNTIWYGTIDTDSSDITYLGETEKIKEKSNEIIPDDVLTKFSTNIKLLDEIKIEYWENLIKIINDIYNYNIAIFFNDYFSLPKVISKIKPNQALVSINVNKDYIEFCYFYNISEKQLEIRLDNYIIQEKILSSKPTFKPLKTGSKIIVKPTASKIEKENFGYIIIDPNDIGVELEVIKININGKNYEFLRGKTNNLYTKSADNILVGKLDGKDLLLVENYDIILR